MQINAAARSVGAVAMDGCFQEFSLGIAAGLHFALDRPNVVYACLDSHFAMKNDPTEGMLQFQNSYLYTTLKPGPELSKNL